MTCDELLKRLQELEADIDEGEDEPEVVAATSGILCALIAALMEVRDNQYIRPLADFVKFSLGLAVREALSGIQADAELKAANAREGM